MSSPDDSSRHYSTYEFSEDYDPNKTYNVPDRDKRTARRSVSHGSYGSPGSHHVSHHDHHVSHHDRHVSHHDRHGLHLPHILHINQEDSHIPKILQNIPNKETGSPEKSGKSYINDATEHSDFEALKEGLSFALGSQNKDAMWFPVSEKNPSDKASSTSDKSHHSRKSPYVDNSSLNEYTDNIQLEDMGDRRYSQFGTNSSDNSYHLSPFIDPSTPSSRPKNRSFNSYNQSYNADMETGVPKEDERPASPTKFTDALARFSERVAGTGSNTLPNDTTIDDSPSKKSNRMSIRTSRNNSAMPTPISGNFSVFRDYDQLSQKESNTSREKVYATSNLSVPNVTIVDENNTSTNIDFNFKKNEDSKISDGLGLYFGDSPDQVHPPASEHHPSILSSLRPSKPSIPTHPISSENVRTYTDPRKMYLFGKSLKIFSPNSIFRQWCHRIISKSLTNLALLILLFVQIVLLSYRQWNPPALGGYYYKGNNWADYVLMVINFIYTFEIVIKIVAYGFVDDHIMFEELGLEYPRDDIKLRFFDLDYLKLFIKWMGFHKLVNKTKKRSEKPSGDSSNEDINIKEVDLNLNDNIGEFQPINLKKKYHDLNSHHVKFDEDDQPDHPGRGSSSQERYHDQSNDSDDSAADLTDSTPANILNEPNTFLLSNRKQNIDSLDLKRAYIRNAWHKIDLFSMIMFWISLLLSINRYDAKHHIMLFRALSCVRILRLINLTTGTSTILKSVRAAIPQLIDVSIFISFFWFLFGIIGVQSFKSSLTRHCVWENPDDPNDTYINSEQYCGSYLGLDGHPKPYIYRDGTPSESIKGFRCPMNSRCISGDNPYGGTVSFDNILQSMELVFVVLSANTFTDIMYYTMDSDNLAAFLFFLFCIFIMTVWLMNVFIAVIVSSFNVTREASKMEKKKKTKRVYFRKFQMPDSATYSAGLAKLKKQRAVVRWYYYIEFVFILLIVADLFVQCFRHANMSDSGRHTLYRFECAFTVTFLAEIIIRFAVHFPNWRLFFLSKRNVFDTFLAIITSVIIIGPVKAKLGHAYYWLTVFQLMRFYRVVLATKITSNLWLKIIGNIKQLFDLALFYFILTFLVSIIVARYFEGGIPQEEFDNVDFPMQTLPDSFIALYVITSTENWTDILYALQEYAGTTSNRSFGAVLLISWFVISNSVILNIFIAVIASTLEVSEEGKRKKQLLQFIENMTDRLQNLDADTGILSKVKYKLFKSKGVKDQLEKAVVNLLLSGTAVKDFLEEDNDKEESDEEDEIRQLPTSSWRRWTSIRYWRYSYIFKNPFYSTKKSKKDTNAMLNNFDPAHFARNFLNERNVLINKQNKFLEKNPYFNKVFYLMSPRHKLRRVCQRLVKPSHGERIDGVEPYKPVSELFVVIMFLATIALVVTTCYVTPLLRKDIIAEHGYYNWAFYLEVAFVGMFTVEFAIKIIADGLLFTPNAYLRSSWNFIDLIVLIALWIEFIAYLRNDGSLSRTVRGLKALRALRLLTVSETAKDNFHNSIISGFGKIINAAIISLCLLWPFSIWGLNIFNGRLGYCTDGSSTKAQCYNEYVNTVFNWDVTSPNVYTEPPLEFNKFSTAFLSLFEIISLEGWVDLLLNVMKSTGVGSVPETNASPFNGVFVVLFNFMSTIFILTLFVSVIISNYSRTTGRAYMTQDQIAWYQVKKILIQVKPSKRKDFDQLSRISKFCYRMTVEKNPYWYRVLDALLFLHILALLLECFPSPHHLDTAREIIYIISSGVFLINSIMLLIGQGWRTFVRYKWNCFALFISFGAFVTSVIGFNLNQGNAFININKLFLVGIVGFVIPRSNRLSQLLRFASASLPQILSLSFTWVVMFLLFAIAMNQIFGLTKIGPDGTGNLNLRSVPKALIVLFRCSFGEGWNYIMNDYTLESPWCTVGNSLDDSDCGNKAFAYILFIAWNIISMYIFVNMFVSLILDSFSYIQSKSNYNSLIQREEIRKFKRTWQKFDSEGRGYIKPIELPKLLHSLEGSLSFHFYKGSLEIPVLCKQWFKRMDPKDPYNIQVNYEAIKTTLDAMDVERIRERRSAYERFMEEAMLNMELNNDPGISFTRILLQLPLYTAFETGQCLNLIDFLERRLLLQKVEKRVQTKRVYETIAAYACRWKYRKNQNHGIRTTDIAFDSQLKRKSYLANENLEINAPSIFVTDTNDEMPTSPKVGTSRRKVPQEYYDEDYDMDDEKSPLSKLDDEGTTSGVYVPKSPLNIYKGKTRNNLKPNRKPPKLFIEIPNSSAQVYDEATSSDVSPFLDENRIESENDVSLIDLSTIGENLENSSWSQAMREVQRDHPNPNQKNE